MTEDRNFVYGESWVGDGDVIARAESTAGRLVMLFSWIAWVARGCPYLIVSHIDTELGIVRFERGT